MESNIFITFVFMKGNELLRLLKKDGWYEVRQHGSKEVRKGILRAILKEAQIKTKKG